MNIRQSTVALTVLAAAALAIQVGAEPTGQKKMDTRVFELRTYFVQPGKMAAIQARFKDHTNKLLEKQGMELVGFWTDANEPEKKLIYLVAHKSKEAADVGWKAFAADPEWKAAAAKSEEGGKLVGKVDRAWLNPAEIGVTKQKAEEKKMQPRVFELRTYFVQPGKMAALQARFKDHTNKLLEKQGMELIGFWTEAKEPEKKLIYLVAHKSKETADAGWKAFQADPEWITAKAKSEEGGKLVEKYESVWLNPTEFSAMK